VSDSSSTPRRRFELSRTRVSPLAIVMLVLAIGAVFSGVALATVPVSHHISRTLTAYGLVGPACGQSQSISTPISGTLSFSWYSSTNVSGDLSLYGQGPGGEYTPYEHSGVSGTGSVPIFAGFGYIFNYCADRSEIVTVNTTVSFQAPLV
jgi:hypothetical protein